MEEPKAVLPGALVAAPTFKKHVLLLEKTTEVPGKSEMRSSLVPQWLLQ